MFSPSEVNSEFIEVYNSTDSIISLKNFKIKYHNSLEDGLIAIDSNYNLAPLKYAVIFEGDYDFEYGVYKTIYYDSCLVLTIDNNSFGRSGMANKSSRQISLINSKNDTVDIHNYSPDNQAGFSDERINYQSNNWANSITLNGTPGIKNSVSPRDFDLAITNFNEPKSYAIVGDSLQLYINVQNRGLRVAENFELNVYFQSKNKLSIYYEKVDLLNPGDSLQREIDVHDFSEGDNLFSAEIVYVKDEYSENDTASIVVKGIIVNETRGDILINEFMYSPINNGSEWIEIFNPSKNQINLEGFRIADYSDTSIIVWNKLVIDTNSYFVFADDSSFVYSYDKIDNYLVTKLPSLNNSGDVIKLLDSLDRIIDSISYSPDWGGKNGKSIERIDPNGSSEDPLNWTESIFPTPGKINSVTQKERDLKIDSVYTDPFYPLINSEARVIIKIDNIGRRDNPFSLKISEDRNDDGIIDLLLEQTELIDLVAGSTILIQTNSRLEVFETKFNVVIELFPLDDEPLNNKYTFEIFPSYSRQTLMINEIMYSPVNYEPEWVELYNNSNYEIDIKEWQISDVVTNPVIKRIEQEIVFPPRSFLVITKSESIFDYHRNIQGLVIKMPFANLNNDSDGLVIMDRNSRTIDSLYYSSSWGGNYGRSLEKRNMEVDSQNENNWDSSIDIEGSTPGRINSISPKKYDLSISDLYTEPIFPTKGERIFPWVKIINLGNFNADNFEVNFSARYENNIYPMGNIKDLFLVGKDSLKITSGNAINIFDTIVLSVRINFSDDEDKVNNYFEKMIVPGFDENTILLNEIMFKTKDSVPEWIEIINNTDSDINIRDWQIGDSKTITIITGSDYIIKPNEFLVISDHSSLPYFTDEVEVIELDLPDFGNIKDAVAIYDFRNAVIDSMKYDVSNDFEYLTSMERISLKRKSTDNDNWVFSLDEKRSTPGRINSVSLLPDVKFGDIIITEIMFDPNENNSEFIELFNPSLKEIELGGWKLCDEGGDYFFIKNHNLLLKPKEYFVLAADSSLLENYSYLSKNINKSILNKSSLDLSNVGKLLYLMNTKNQIVDSLSYSESWHNSSFLETKNISIELINVELLRNDEKNWNSSVSEFGATPGLQNSINVENVYSTARLEIFPNPFSPDSDGFEDFTYINYNLTKPVSEIRVRVFDSKGRYVRSIANSRSVGSKGAILFDGLDNNKRPLKVGIYIVLFEAVSNNAAVDVLKEVVVVARKL